MPSVHVSPSITHYCFEWKWNSRQLMPQLLRKQRKHQVIQSRLLSKIASCWGVQPPRIHSRSPASVDWICCGVTHFRWNRIPKSPWIVSVQKFKFSLPYMSNLIMLICISVVATKYLTLLLSKGGNNITSPWNGVSLLDSFSKVDVMLCGNEGCARKDFAELWLKPCSRNLRLLCRKTS